MLNTHGLQFLLFAFIEAFVLSGIVTSSAILFSICIIIYNADLLSIYYIVPLAILGAHAGDTCSFLFGKTIGPTNLNYKSYAKKAENNN